MATLKNMTRVGADVRQIARLLQAKAPEGHMLAYITPDEAKLLKSQGGSGQEHENTGVPSFENEYDGGYDTGGFEGIEFQASEPNPVGQVTGTDLPSAVPYVANKTAAAYPSGFDAPVGADRFPSAATPQVDFAGQSRISEGQAVIPYMPSGAFPAGAYAPPEGGAGRGYEPYQIDTAKEPSATLGQKYNDLAKYLGIAPEMLGRVGIAGISSLYGAYQAKQARDDAAAAKKQQEALAIPYQTKGQELQRQAQAGELTAVGQQQLKAVQAQAAQSASSRGGVGAQQNAARVEAIRNQLLQQQNDYGLKLSGIGDQILLGAIRTGLEADRYVNQLSNTYFTNVARTLAGSPTIIQYGAQT